MKHIHIWRRCLMGLLLCVAGAAHAQSDSVAWQPPLMTEDSATIYEGWKKSVSIAVPTMDTLAIDSLRARIATLQQQLHTLEQQQLRMGDSLKARNDSLVQANDSLTMRNDAYQSLLQRQNELLESKVSALEEKERLVAEKEALYQQALQASSLDSARYNYALYAKKADIDAKLREIELLQRNLEERDLSLKDEKKNYELLSAERKQCLQIADSLRAIVVAIEKENVRQQEENKYLLKRAKDAEEQVNTATNRKKKVRPVQGIAMRFFRTPNWNIRLTPQSSDGTTVTYQKQIWNRNAGNIEFDYITGASVMLWDLSKYFNQKSESTAPQPTTIDFRKFDQQFAYDLGVYVGFGGSNLFKNFYVGPSFRFMDFFYLVVGINICEYEMLSAGYTDGQFLNTVETLDDIVAKAWLVKPFVALSIDLDFLSYIKK